jgi:uncharacterized RDD family membrane protein YckC
MTDSKPIQGRKFSKNLDPRDLSYAGLGIRSIAFLLDLIFLGFIIGIMEIILYGEASPLFGLLDLNWKLVGLYFAVFFLYFGWTESSRSQASIGKMIMDLKVVGENGERISFLTSVYRYLLTYLSTVSFGLGFVPALKTSRKAGWHDRISKSYVVRAYRDMDEF